MRFRSAERCCQFFRDRIHADSKILDCGCGPGGITIGLAKWAPDGQTVGIDIAAEQLERASSFADSLGISNVTFRQGSVFELPFENESFDIVFSHAVFCHIPRHEDALCEFMRVLRPGGLVAIRDIINGQVVTWPNDPLIREAHRIFRLGEKVSGGQPDIGQELGVLLQRVGFNDVFLTLDFEQPERPDERHEYYSLIARLLESGDLGSLAVKEGWITIERLEQVVSRLRDFADVPGSISALPFGQALGTKPL